MLPNWSAQIIFCGSVLVPLRKRGGGGGFLRAPESPALDAGPKQCLAPLTPLFPTFVFLGLGVRSLVAPEISLQLAGPKPQWFVGPFGQRPLTVSHNCKKAPPAGPRSSLSDFGQLCLVCHCRARVVWCLERWTRNGETGAQIPAQR